MNTKKLTYLSLGSVLMLASCSQDELANREHPGDGNRIYFRSYLPTVTMSRAADASSSSLSTCQVTCFNQDDKNLIDPVTGEMTPYFTDTRFEDDGSGRFFSTGEDECIWPDANSRLHFFAYYPSADSMKDVSGESFFNLVNASKLVDNKPVFDYRLENFRVAKDIADQVDFVTAYAAGTLAKNTENAENAESGSDGIKLDFKHQLARVELTAWGDNDKYDFEIAGVRIGNPIVEGDFDFSPLISSYDDAEYWQNVSGHNAPVEHIFNTGETIVLLSHSKESHNSEDKVASIMGKAGAAMVIPMQDRIEAWEGKDDPATAAPDYSTDKMYFSVLLRVKNSDGGVAYPYINASDEMTIIYLAVDKESGVVNKRLYKIDGEYYTTPEKSQDSIYKPASTEDACEFSWAALPVPAKWEAGKKYTYKLNYTYGIGWHDPADPEPGEPIIERGGIPFSVSVDRWISADDYTPDIDVPKR